MHLFSFRKLFVTCVKLLHFHPEGCNQLLDQEGIPPFLYGYFQLPSARESSDEEKTSIKFN